MEAQVPQSKPQTQALDPQKLPATRKTVSPMDALLTTLDKMKSSIKGLLPSHVSEDRFMRTARTAVRMNPRLLECDRNGLFSELMKCAGDGLLPDGREAAIMPFKDQAKYVPMVYGICKRARNSGEVKTIDAIVVYENDSYKAWTDENGAHFKHERAPLGSDRGNPCLTLAYGTTKDGGFFFEEIDEKSMKAIKDMAVKKANGKPTPWTGPFEDEMRRKSALRRLLKYRMPSSSDVDGIFEREDADFQAESTPQHSEPQKAVAQGPRRTTQIIEAQSVKESESESGDQNVPI